MALEKLGLAALTNIKTLEISAAVLLLFSLGSELWNRALHCCSGKKSNERNSISKLCLAGATHSRQRGKIF